MLWTGTSQPFPREFFESVLLYLPSQSCNVHLKYKYASCHPSSYVENVSFQTSPALEQRPISVCTTPFPRKCLELWILTCVCVCGDCFCIGLKLSWIKTRYGCIQYMGSSDVFPAGMLRYNHWTQNDFSTAAHLWNEAVQGAIHAGASLEDDIAPLHSNRSVALLRLAVASGLGTHSFDRAREAADQCITAKPKWSVLVCSDLQPYSQLSIITLIHYICYPNHVFFAMFHQIGNICIINTIHDTLQKEATYLLVLVCKSCQNQGRMVCHISVVIAACT